MPLDDYLARKDWIAPRQDRWSDILPESWQTAINTSPTLNALARYMNRPGFEEGVKQWQDSIPGNSPIDRIADKKSTLAQEFPSPMNPLGQSLMETGGFLANFIGPGAKLPPASAPKPQGIRAYHGSPHDFDKFDISKIGTGEGAQAYGRGLYFAESEGVARSYRDALTEGTVKFGNRYIPTAESLKGASPRYLEVYDNLTLAEKLLSDYNGNYDRAIRDALELAKITRAKPNDRWLKTPPEQYEAAAAQLQQMRTGEWAPPHQGRMYEVRINADPETFLDWDKPLSQQPEAVRRALKEEADRLQAMPELGPRRNGRHVGQTYFDRDSPASETYLSLAESGGREVVTNRLRDAGIPGIKYKDQMSRGTDGGTSNYVVFDDALIQILRKYGLLPPVAAGAAAADQLINGEGGSGPAIAGRPGFGAMIRSIMPKSQPKSQPIRAFHGSDADFNKFDATNAGDSLTYARGLHFSPNRDLAKEYGEKLYEVALNMDPSRTVNWSSPFSEQPAAVAKALKDVGFKPVQRPPDDPRSDLHLAWNELRQRTNLTDEQISAALRDRGIHGVNQSADHMIVFDDKLIEILRKYGLLPPVAAGAAQALSQGQDTAY